MQKQVAFDRKIFNKTFTIKANRCVYFSFVMRLTHTNNNQQCVNICMH